MPKIFGLARILALDYGKVRTGIAVTDELQLIASGLTTVETKDLIPFLMDYVEKESVERFVVGLPKQMDNTPSESEVLIQPFLKKMAKSSLDGGEAKQTVLLETLQNIETVKIQLRIWSKHKQN